MSDTTEVSPRTLFRARRYQYHEGGHVYGGEVHEGIKIVTAITGILTAIAVLVGGVIFLTYKSDKAECDALARVRPEIEYEYGFWSGCVGGFDENDHLDVDGEVDVNLNTEDD